MSTEKLVLLIGRILEIQEALDWKLSIRSTCQNADRNVSIRTQRSTAEHSPNFGVKLMQEVVIVAWPLRLQV